MSASELRKTFSNVNCGVCVLCVCVCACTHAHARATTHTTHLGKTSTYRRCICSLSRFNPFSKSTDSLNLTKASPFGRPSRPKHITTPSRSIAQPSKKSLTSRSEAEYGRPRHLTTSDLPPDDFAEFRCRSRSLFWSERRGLRVRLRSFLRSSPPPLLSPLPRPLSASGLSSRLRPLL